MLRYGNTKADGETHKVFIGLFLTRAGRSDRHYRGYLYIYKTQRTRGESIRRADLLEKTLESAAMRSSSSILPGGERVLACYLVYYGPYVPKTTLSTYVLAF